jgi:hypothetical protein
VATSSATASAATPSGFSLVAPPAAAASSDIRDVDAVGHRAVWLVGERILTDSARALVLRWDGSHWRMPSQPLAGVRSRLTTVDAVSRRSVWAGGSVYRNGQQHAVVLRFNGSSWRLAPAPPGESVSSLTVRSTGVVWAVTSAYDATADCGVERLYRFVDGAWHATGQVWWECVPDGPSVGRITAIPGNGPVIAPGGFFLHEQGEYVPEMWCFLATCPPKPAWNWTVDQVGGFFGGVTGASASDIWLAGYSVPSFDGVHNPIVEHWNGDTWRILRPPAYAGSSHQLEGIAEISPTNVWAVGGRLNPSGEWRTLIDHWNGTSWSDLGGPNVTKSGGDSFTRVVHVPGTRTEMWTIGWTQNGRPLIAHHP